MSKEPRKVIVKTLTTSKDVHGAFTYFEDMKNLEAGGAIKSLVKTGDGGWWSGDTPAGKARIRHTLVSKEHGILDHVFAGQGITWDVYVRIVPNNGGATVSWTFVRPNGMTDGQFEEQLKAFDTEIENWERDLEK
ncbi:hypothetical protein NTE_01070 [Candidatus Nitrososphaera evergladensis SR1]|jgi:hypothetical protein|uniref:Polyketide cyclase / dehydrase and lipid transport n=1 Tax=Candidatus Nitrososphaera evergladensis SR1 TaxID=1459636 RepID=A0A075MPK2_9ARCH|nr:hypothetical protein [Candidatus Nitrososphaera evergladensis]AIF83143.1 hypothetical protein NTE_01070 [Candidatus Nitrososphaera evergladensis SR1]